MKNKQSTFPTIIIKSGVIKDQVYFAIKDAILEGRLKAGARIPSSRGLAEMLSVSRNSVLAGLERLFDEGYLISKVGSGTYVAALIPDEFVVAPNASNKACNDRFSGLTISPTMESVHSLWQKTQPQLGRHKLFNVGVGCVDLFPHEIWGRLLGRAWRQARKSLGSAGDPKGYLPLRKNISDYVRSVRGINCSAEQVIIVNGTQQAMNLVAQVLLTKGDKVWLDNPGYDGALSVFTVAGTNVQSIPNDEYGMDIEQGKQICPDPKLIFITPSHQFPMGGMLSLPRRLSLLDWAAEKETWILEDDYNSEFRYTTHPIQALQGLDKYRRVIYAGTFSKMMFPEFRLGFLIVPPQLTEFFTVAKYYADTCSTFLEQSTLALFIAEGHYARHVRRVRAACLQRQKALIAAIQRYLPDKLSIHAADSGIHLLCWLRGGLTEADAITKCREAGLGVQPLSRYCQQPIDRRGLLLGYAAHTEQQIIEGVKQLATIL